MEVEAYPVGDPAGHAFGGKAQRNASLYLARGHAYVYFVYGMYYCLNISSEKPGIGAGVLFRALEPLEGIELMKKRRPSSSLRDLARGPGRLTVAMAIDASYDGVDLCTGSFAVAWHIRFRIPRRCGSEHANRPKPHDQQALALLRTRQQVRQRSLAS